MTINSKQKGNRGELELAHKLSSYGYECRRSQQFAGINGDADVVGLPGIHCESKRVEALRLYDALEQSCRDAKTDELPAVFHKKNRKPWVVIMSLDDWMKLYKKWSDEQ